VLFSGVEVLATIRLRSDAGVIATNTVSLAEWRFSVIAKKRFEAQVSNNHSQGRSPFWAKSPGHSNAASEEKAFAVFQSDILIPEQFLATYQRTFRLDPEKVLMLAVLQDAVTCFQENIAATCKRKRALYQEAEEWFDAEDKSYLFSFENICEALGFDVSYLRQGLLRWKQKTAERQSRQALTRAAG
jgi:hypothetical protein